MTNPRLTPPFGSETAIDQPSVDGVWRTCGPAVLRFATVLVGPDDAHDVMSNAFLRICRTTGWIAIEHPQSYWFRAVQSEAQNHHRKRRRQWRRDLNAVTPVESVDRRRNLDLIDQIAKLSIPQRSVVYFAYWEDMTEAAIADALDLSTGTVHRTLTRARNQLRKALS